MVRLRVRIRYAKQGDLRFIGHRDLMRCFERVFRRAGLAMQFSQGFHPKPRMTFPAALAVGIEGLDEVMEVELANAGKGDSPHLCEAPGGPFRQMGTVPFSGEPITADELLRRLTPRAPAGLEFRSAEVLPEGSRKFRVRAVRYEVPIPSPPPGILDRVERLMSASSWPITRPLRSAPIDLRAQVAELAFDGDRLTMLLAVPQRGGSAGPRDVLTALGLDDCCLQGSPPRRTAVEACQ
ncbi:MAG: DUF2344 domain-containing protein [Pirellulales bacterium]|nr:DUF2344 domain-containing protein [Pirellulales bacterium]